MLFETSLFSVCTWLQELEKEIANFGKDRDKRIKAAKEKVKAAKAAVEAAKKELKAKQTALQVGGWWMG